MREALDAMEREFGNHRKKINISTSLAGQRLGIKEVDDAIWLVSFMGREVQFFRYAWLVALLKRLRLRKEDA